MVKPFGDMQKVPQDLLGQDYFFDKKVKINSVAVNGVKFTAEGTLKPKATLASLSLTKFAPFHGFTVEKLALSEAGRFKTEVAMVEEQIKGAKFILKAEDGGGKDASGEVCVEYSRQNARIDVGVNLQDGPTLSAAATYEHKNVTAGGEVKVNSQYNDSGSAKVDDYNAAVGYVVSPDLSIAVKSKKKFTVFNLTLHHQVSAAAAVAAEAEMNRENGAKTLTVGGSYAVDPSLTVQGKFDSNAIVSANLIQKVSSAIKLQFSAQVDARTFSPDSHKFGVQALFG